jgi:hypothetical protein
VALGPGVRRDDGRRERTRSTYIEHAIDALPSLRSRLISHAQRTRDAFARPIACTRALAYAGK